MTENFNIIEYLAGLTGFVFDITVLKRIAIDRHVTNITTYEELDLKTKELLRADLLYTAYTSPNVWAGSTQSHGSYTKTIGNQKIYSDEKERLYNTILSIYRKYDDDKLAEIEDLNGTLEFIDIC